MPAKEYDESELSVEAIQGWKHDPEVQREFSDVAQYFHYLKAKVQGKVKILGEPNHVH